MRISLPNTTRPKKAAKAVARLLGVPLARSQRAVAQACGYRDWHDLEGGISVSPVSLLDQELDHVEFIRRQSQLSLKLAASLGIPDGHAQFALSAARLTGDRPPSLADQIAIRLACLRATSLPPVAPRTPGAVGTLNSPGFTGTAVILRTYGNSCVVMTRGCIVRMYVAASEYVTPRSEPALFLPMPLYMPYGFWTEADGAKVIFSRDYKPMWRIRPDRSVERLDPWLWINKVSQTYLWVVGEEPWNNVATAEKLETWMAEQGISGLPILADALPLLVHDAQAGLDDVLEVMKDARAPTASRASSSGSAPQIAVI